MERGALARRSAYMGLPQANHHSMVGSTNDPADGKAVAGSVFAAVIVYAVRLQASWDALFAEVHQLHEDRLLMTPCF